MKSVFYAGAGIQSVLFFLNDGYLSATLACGSGVSPRTVRWGGTLLPQAVGRAMEWPDSCPRRKLPAHRSVCSTQKAARRSYRAAEEDARCCAQNRRFLQNDRESSQFCSCSRTSIDHLFYAVCIRIDSVSCRRRVSGRGTSDDYSDADSTFDRYV